MITINEEKLDPKVQATFAKLEKKFGFVPNIFKTMGLSPDLAETAVALFGSMSEFKLDPKLKELAYLKSSLVNDCSYCSAHHSKTALAAGLTAEQLDALKNDDLKAFSDLEKTVIEFATQITKTTHCEDSIIKSLQTELGQQEMVELAFTVGFANLTNRFNHALDVQLEPQLKD